MLASISPVPTSVHYTQIVVCSTSTFHCSTSLLTTLSSCLLILCSRNLPMPREQTHPVETARRRKKGLTFILTAFILGILCSTHPKQYFQTPEAPEKPRHKSRTRAGCRIDDDERFPPRRVDYTSSQTQKRPRYASRRDEIEDSYDYNNRRPHRI